MKQKDLKSYPVDDYPYLAIKPGGRPVYYRSLKEAIGKLRGELEDLNAQFKRTMNLEASISILNIISELGEIGADGGSIDRVLDTHSHMRYRVEVRRREAV